MLYMTEAERTARILAVVFAPGTTIRRAAYLSDMCVVVNGLTGKDACERNVEECFDALFYDEDRNK